MKALLDFSLLLFCFLQAVRAQDVVCIQAVTTTIAYVPALTLSNDACPMDKARGIEYNKVGTFGCCTADATAKTLLTSGIACCPCGAQCTGYFPDKQQWTTQNGQLLVSVSTTESGRTRTYATQPAAIATPVHGPHTATSSSDGAAGTSSGGGLSTPSLAVSTSSSGDSSTTLASSSGVANSGSSGLTSSAAQPGPSSSEGHTIYSAAYCLMVLMVGLLLLPIRF